MLKLAFCRPSSEGPWNEQLELEKEKIARSADIIQLDPKAKT